METNNTPVTQASNVDQIKTLFNTLKHEEQKEMIEWMEKQIILGAGERIKEKAIELEKTSNSFFAKLQDKFKLNK